MSLINFIVVIVFVFLVATLWYLNVGINAKKRLDYIKNEIERNEGIEKEYWNTELRIFYISNIPFVGKILQKFIR